MTEERIDLHVSGPGTYRIAVRFSRFWRPSLGCVSRGGDGMMRLSVPRAGAVGLRFAVDAERALDAVTGERARTCRG